MPELKTSNHPTELQDVGVADSIKWPMNFWPYRWVSPSLKEKERNHYTVTNVFVTAV